MKKTVGEHKKYISLIPYGIILIAFLVFLNSINNDFILLDDPEYVLENEQVKSLSFQNISNIFSSYTHGHYQPLSVLTYAIDYSIYGLNAYGFRMTNILLHLVNILLVFIFIRRLSGRFFVAVVVSLLFAVHPLRVESVVWISERKDVLYAVFYFSALICYLNYLEKNKSVKYILLTCLFFILALLSKSMAVSLPIVLLLIDWYKKRKFSIRLVIEKVPFLLLSVVFGLIVINSQQSSGLLEDTMASFTFFDRILLSSYSAVIYIYKVFVPFNTLFMTDYPNQIDGHLPIYFYLAPLFIGLIGLLIYKARIFRRELVFGLFFYLITISLVLQIIPVSGFLWDHYSYVPSVGILFIVGQFFGYIQDRRFSYAQKLKGPLNFILVFFVLTLIVVTWNRNIVWENSGSLFTEVIRLNLDNEAAYVNRGLYFLEQGNYIQAENDFSQAIKVKDFMSIAWLSRGRVRVELKKYTEAMKDMDQAIRLAPSENAYLLRGKLKADLGYHQEAIEDFKQAFKRNYNSSKALNNIGLSLAKLEKYNDALAYFNKAIEINPGSASAYGNRGTLYYQTGNKQKACTDWQQSAKLGNERANQILLKYCK